MAPEIEFSGVNAVVVACEFESGELDVTGK